MQDREQGLRARRQESSRTSLLVQRVVNGPVMDEVCLPGTPDVRLVLAESGWTTSIVRVGGRCSRHEWGPGQLCLNVPGVPIVSSYRAAGTLRSVQLDLPAATVERTVEQLGGPAVDLDSVAASVASGDPLLAEVIRTVVGADEVGDLYAESAAAFLAVHLLTRHSGRPRPRMPLREDARVRAVVDVMRDRMAEPLTLTDLAGEVHLTVYHFVRVFKEATGETPHRFLTRIRLEQAERLLRATALPVAAIAPRCGFASPGALSTAFLRHTGLRPSAYRVTHAHLRPHL